jgi:peptidoglycan/xylan/chitin deacetylase (PgdA/CDA1 family)
VTGTDAGQGQAAELRRGTFTLSFDFELIWGTLDRAGPDGFAYACAVEREQIVDELLAMLDELEIPATWCVLGHIMLRSCSPSHGVKHPEIVRPRHAWHPDDWFIDDPCGDELRHPNFYGASLVDRIRACRVPQEIGCHSFSHPIFGDPGCSRDTADSELAACTQIAAAESIQMRSFAFPRNRVGHLDMLLEHGFVCFRGPEPHWYERPRIPRALKRAVHLMDVVLANRPPLVLPRRVGGLWNVPGSMIYLPAHGVRRFVPVRSRVRKAIKGLDGAASEKKLFHLWLHPTNLADRLPEMLSGLRAVLARAAQLRDRGELAIVPMGAVPDFTK